MTDEEQAEFLIRMGIETALEDIELAVRANDWEGPPYKFLVEETEELAEDEEREYEIETEDQIEYDYADRGASREKAEDAINRLHNLITDIAAAGSVRNLLDGKKEGET